MSGISGYSFGLNVVCSFMEGTRVRCYTGRVEKIILEFCLTFLSNLSILSLLFCLSVRRHRNGDWIHGVLAVRPPVHSWDEGRF